jgi:hypothetical protein
MITAFIPQLLNAESAMKDTLEGMSAAQEPAGLPQCEQLPHDMLIIPAELYLGEKEAGKQ